MPQALPYIAYVAANYFGASAIATAVIVTAASYVSAELTKPSKPRRALLTNDKDPGQQINFRDSQSPVPIVYGEIKIGGNQPYISVSGEENKYLNIIQTISEGEIEGIVEIGGVSQIWLDDSLIGDFGPKVYWEFKNGGNDNQTICSLGDPSFEAYDPNWTDLMKDTAYLYIRLEYDRELFTSIPTITLLVKGKKVLDPRTGIVSWSDNAALCFYDFVTNDRYGVGMDSSFWDAGIDGNIASVATWCEEKNYLLNCILAEREPGLDTAFQILTTFRSTIFWSEEKFILHKLDWEAPVLSLTEDDIVADSFSFDLPSLQSLPNTIRIKYTNAENGFILEDLVLHDPEAIAADGEIREQELSLLITSQDQATKIGAYQLERQRLNIPFSFVAGPKAFPVEPGDFITVTHSLPGWIDQIVRVQRYQPLEDNNVALTVLLEIETLYDDVVNVVSHTQWASTLPDPLAVPVSVSNIQFSEEVYAIKDNTFTRLKITWQPPVNYLFLDHVEVWGAARGAGQPQPDDDDYICYGKAWGSFTIESSAKEGDQWYFKLLSVSTYGVKMSLTDANSWSYSIIGKSGVKPDDVSGFMGSATGDSVGLRWLLPNTGEERDRFANDLSGYEIRTGAEWDSALFLGFTKTQLWSLVGVKPGTHTFLIKAKNTLGEYSENAGSSTIQVFTPPGYTIQRSINPSQYNDFSSGSFNNTEAYNHPTYGTVLRVIHAGGLSGDYTSPVYNFSSAQIARFWLDFQVVIALTSITWTSYFSAGEHWTNRISSGKTWVEFLHAQAGKLSIKFFYSQDNIIFYELDNFQILCCEVQAKYFKYQIFIEDLSTYSYIYVKAITADNNAALNAYYWQ
ncbi:MAG: phage tail protein [bacterium]